MLFLSDRPTLPTADRVLSSMLAVSHPVCGHTNGSDGSLCPDCYAPVAGRARAVQVHEKKA